MKQPGIGWIVALVLGTALALRTGEAVAVEEGEHSGAATDPAAVLAAFEQAAHAVAIAGEDATVIRFRIRRLGHPPQSRK